MSADLFAEFDSFSPPTSQPPTSEVKPSAQSTSLASDPFSFAGVTPAKSPGLPETQTQQLQQWPSLQQQPPLQLNADPWGGFQGAGLSEAASQNAINDDDDGWGDFEVAETQPAPAAAANPSGFATSVRAAPPPLTLPRTRLARASTIELMTNSLIDIPGANTLPEEVRTPSWVRQSFEQQLKEKSTQAEQKSRPKVSHSDPNVLFDADDFDGELDDNDDDFGDFETVTSPAQAPADHLFTPPTTAKMTSTPNYIDLAPTGSTTSYPQAPKSPSYQERNPFPGLALHAPTESKTSQSSDPKTSPVTAWPTVEGQKASPTRNDTGADWGSFEDFRAEAKPSKDVKSTHDGWGSFEDLRNDSKPSKDVKSTNDGWDWDAFESKPPAKTEIKQPKITQPKTAVENADSSWVWDSVDTGSEVRPKPTEERAPPTNVPPPSVLLSVFPQLLGQADEALYKPIAGQSFSIKNRILSDPKTVEFIEAYLLLATVAARIIAGRKHRWHRDKFLAQGMSISAAGAKGMKLAGVDKTQAAREDREAGDIVDLWKEHVGRLRSSVAAVNSSVKAPGQHLKVPDLRENMQVQTAKTVPTAPKSCIVCGLKRDERIGRVDFEVEDSFGEWWTEHWGHTTCKRFWLQHEDTLRQR